MPLVMFNPEIAARSGELQRCDEGCLSFPDIHTPVARPGRVTAVFLNYRGEKQTLEACGLLARAIQHELDHLNGTLLVDRMSPIKKISLSGQLKRLKHEGEEQAAGTK
jgi:peptide deformylase